jgi:hypothetical protein
MKRSPRSKFWYLLALGASGLTASGVGLAVTSISDLNATRIVEVGGQVTSLFGNKFVLNDGSGEILVDTAPSWWSTIAVTQGEMLRVRGELGDDDFDAFRITRADGTVIEIRPEQGPPPWPGGPNRDGDRPGRPDGPAGPPGSS